jgi:ADP-ribose pyrophosphatase YjhB (NUDIX family)
LTDFPRPSVAVDVAVLTVDAGRLGVVLWCRTGNTESGRWALPGSFVQAGERLDDTVARTLQAQCGITGLAPTQLRVMDDPRRDDRGWVLSVAHLDVARAAALADRRADGEVQIATLRLGDSTPPASKGSIVELPDGQTALPFDHESIVRLAVAALQASYVDRPDPAGLLDGPFTFLRLRNLHEIIAGRSLQRDTFRRAMLPYVEPLDEIEQGAVGRPARLYRRIDESTSAR